MNAYDGSRLERQLAQHRHREIVGDRLGLYKARRSEITVIAEAEDEERG